MKNEVVDGGGSKTLDLAWKPNKENEKWKEKKKVHIKESGGEDEWDKVHFSSSTLTEEAEEGLIEGFELSQIICSNSGGWVWEITYGIHMTK